MGQKLWRTPKNKAGDDNKRGIYSYSVYLLPLICWDKTITRVFALKKENTDGANDDER